MKVNTNILIKPLISEKSTELGEDLNKFSFVVARTTNKLEVKKAVEEMYGVTVKSVRTAVMPGKSRQRYTKTGLSKGQTSARKKAVVTLEAGDTIDFYSNI